jgi:hypothetical protein
MRGAMISDTPRFSQTSINNSDSVPMRRRMLSRGLLFVLVCLGLLTLAVAQSSPHVTGIAPAQGKVNDTATVSGENLGKGSISAVLLSDDKADFKATIVEQAADKVAIKVPDVKPGDYNVSIQVGNNIFIQPVRFKVQ